MFWLQKRKRVHWYLISDSCENEQGSNNPWSLVSRKIPAYKEMSSCSNAAPCTVRVPPLGSPDFQKLIALSTRQKAATGSFLKVKAQRQKERGRGGLRRVGCDQELNFYSRNTAEGWNLSWFILSAPRPSPVWFQQSTLCLWSAVGSGYRTAYVSFISARAVAVLCFGFWIQNGVDKTLMFWWFC